jgi:hypothetical protein
MVVRFAGRIDVAVFAVEFPNSLVAVNERVIADDPKQQVEAAI